jgi:hypothetical protein
MWPLSGMQWVCIGVGVAQLALLVGVYAGEARADDAFVSKELERAAGFKLLLTMTVLAQICISGFYLYEWSSGLYDCRLCAGEFGLTVALCGWCVVGSTVMETAEHVVGTCMFLGGTACYVAMMVAVGDGRWAACFSGGMYAVTTGLAVAFLVTHLMGDMEASATVEWLGFMAQALGFTVFFALHSFREGGDSLWPGPHPSQRASGELASLLHTGEAEVASGLI